MNGTYRDIFKWGDKRETVVDKGTIKLIKEKIGYTDEELKQKHLFGNEQVKLEKPSGLSPEIISNLEQIVGKENVGTDDYSRAAHAYGKYYADLLLLRMGKIPTPPDAVVFPRNADEVIKIVELCNANKIAITPFGGHSSVTRGVETPKGGISLDLTKHLNKVLEVNEINSTCTVQAGMYGPAFEDFLNAKGYSCGHFPQSFEYSTVGGWFAAKGAGQASTGYGKIEHMVLAVKVVTPSGVVETKCYPASAQGWDLHQIFAGSEGTLGVIVEVTMKIRKYRPENTKHASFIFKNFESAVNAMRIAMQGGVGLPHLYRISDPEETEIAFKTKEFDGTFADKFLNTLGYKSGSRCLMFVAIEGDRAYTKQVSKSISRIGRKNGGFAIGGNPTKKWLEQRYSSAYLRDPLMDLGIMTDTLETAVMWDNLIPVWKSVRSYLKSRDKTVVMVHISHVYENGANLYFTFLSPMMKGNELNEYIEYHKGIIETINKAGGSLSHHHGVGRTLAPWMEQQLGKENLALMQAIKNHLDPNGIMNPGGTLGLIP
ncbi:MAG TPA: FAD-binding oxidoreductase [Tenuifilaceae bacterium]|nr:FAD-binding oxidoreductase [Tenuifilaceae bacterium]HPE18705.1 FAD-binding oxidoreductase [Tenuifilaceae bacterium]HPJ45702.1 FAD-binding oxidoreductase [Tenuifilaceae bacterium]